MIYIKMCVCGQAFTGDICRQCGIPSVEICYGPLQKAQYTINYCRRCDYVGRELPHPFIVEQRCHK